MAAIFKEFDCLTLAWLAPRLKERAPVPYTFRYNRLQNRFVLHSSISHDVKYTGVKDAKTSSNSTT
ncbi:hypothetical protein MiSe_79720 [Microseira wollei NIES-4236]|uniref:Uncharacterized protein n=1 Tax=Microseira wollei NIES-4236 TaxID=2530354 RepID=A0AAV3XQG5_9CYAN|nr:hypothetical protein MiSe_79720 [Microseira wollei NIES-4236]